eukprot:4832305-Alexandrium_andersonii.AAC.1
MSEWGPRCEVCDAADLLRRMVRDVASQWTPWGRFTATASLEGALVALSALARIGGEGGGWHRRA